VYKRGLLDPGDIDKISALLQSWGGGQNTASTTSLVNAFNAGYSSGDPSKCVQSSGSPGTGG
jgi:hypothetical protein